MKRLTFGLTLILTSALAAPTFAAGPSTIEGVQSDIGHSLAGLDFDITSERVTFAKRGRRDLTLTSPSAERVVVAQLKNAYKKQSKLANGYKVVGWFKVAATNSWTFTLEKGSTSYVAEVKSAANGTKLKVWGAAYDWRPQRKALSTIPRRFVPVSGPTFNR